MKLKEYKMALLSLVFLLCSCQKDFVDLTPPSILPVQNFYKTELDIKTAVTGTYGLLRTNYGAYYLLNEMPSDNAQTYAESEAGIGVFDKLTWQASSAELANLWIDHYNTIAQCNTVIEKADGVTFANSATKDQYIAEVKFIRALMYFNLVRYFGNVPLVLKVLTTEAEAYSYKRSPVAEVYTQIEKDLKDAETVLPVVYSLSGTSNPDLGRATKGAAKALLGKVYLQQKKYGDAEIKLKEVVAMSPSTYDLLTNYADIFSTTNEFNKEIVFTIQYSRVVPGAAEGSNFAVDFLPQTMPNPPIKGGTASSYNIGTVDLYNTFEPGDLRKDLIGVYNNGATNYYYTKKFQDRDAPSRAEGENNWIVIRYADVLLMLAEALNEQNKPNLALLEVQKVRSRANLTTNLLLNQTDTKALIKKERRVELCYEGHRWPDLIRWDDYVTVMTNFKAAYNVASMNIDASKKLFPIPSREIALNPNLGQN